MKPDLHPKLREVELIMPNGDSFRTMSTIANDKIYLDVDYREHHAWKGGAAVVNQSVAQVSKFNKKFAGFLQEKKANKENSEN